MSKRVRANRPARVKRSSEEPSPFAWKVISSRLLEAVSTNAGEAFCEFWVPQLFDAMEAASVRYAEGGGVPADYGDLQETYEGLLLVRDWYLPSRSRIRATEAIRALRTYIAGNMVWHGPDPENPDLPAERLSAFSERLDRFRQLASDPEFLARVAARLAPYELSNKESPAVSVWGAIDAEVTRKIGPWSGSRPKRTALSEHLKQLFARAETDPLREALQRCLFKLSNEQRELVSHLYAHRKTYKELEDRWGKRKTNEVRQASLKVLMDCMPDLARYR